MAKNPSKPGFIDPVLIDDFRALKCENPSDESLAVWLIDNKDVVTEGQVKWLRSLVDRKGARFKND